jgi:hypothetical protein
MRSTLHSERKNRRNKVGRVLARTRIRRADLDMTPSWL